MKRLIDKVIAVVVLFPPLYMLFRFLRWSLQQERPQTTEEEI